MQNKGKHDGVILFKNGLDTMKINASNQQYECEICDNDFLSPVQLTIHCIVEHRVIPCVECLKLFGNEYQLKQHKQSSCHRKNPTCTECSITFSNETTIIEHMIDEHSKRKCNLCTAIIPNEIYSEHLRYAHRAINVTTAAASLKTTNHNWFTCNFCEKDLNIEKFISHCIFLHKCSMDSLIRNIFDGNGKAILPLELLKTTIDESRDGTKCSDCRALFTFSIPKIFHKVYCLGLNYCVLCNSCVSNEHLNNHKHNEEEIMLEQLLNYPFNCDLCGVDFTFIENNLEALVEHFRVTHGVNDEVILRSMKKIQPTTNCRRKRNRESIDKEPNHNYYSEIRSNENTNCEIKLDFDTKMVKYLYSSESDYDSADDTVERSTQLIEQRHCDFCRFSSKSKYVFARHLHEKHGFLLKNPCFDCGPCRKTFTINRILQKHIKTVHHKQISANAKRYKCPFCDYASNFKQKTR